MNACTTYVTIGVMPLLDDQDKGEETFHGTSNDGYAQ